MPKLATSQAVIQRSATLFIRDQLRRRVALLAGLDPEHQTVEEWEAAEITEGLRVEASHIEAFELLDDSARASLLNRLQAGILCPLLDPSLTLHEPPFIRHHGAIESAHADVGLALFSKTLLRAADLPYDLKLREIADGRCTFTFVRGETEHDIVMSPAGYRIEAWEYGFDAPWLERASVAVEYRHDASWSSLVDSLKADIDRHIGRVRLMLSAKSARGIGEFFDVFTHWDGDARRVTVQIPGETLNVQLSHDGAQVSNEDGSLPHYAAHDALDRVANFCTHEDRTSLVAALREVFRASARQ